MKNGEIIKVKSSQTKDKDNTHRIRLTYEIDRAEKKIHKREQKRKSKHKLTDRKNGIDPKATTTGVYHSHKMTNKTF